jgi:hypothetical protein
LISCNNTLCEHFETIISVINKDTGENATDETLKDIKGYCHLYECFISHEDKRTGLILEDKCIYE